MKWHRRDGLQGDGIHSRVFAVELGLLEGHSIGRTCTGDHPRHLTRDIEIAPAVVADVENQVGRADRGQRLTIGHINEAVAAAVDDGPLRAISGLNAGF